MVTKNRKQKAKRNMDTFFLQAKTLATLTPVQGVQVHNYVYIAYTLDPRSTYNFYTNNAEFNLYRLQYDKFRINSITAIVTPKANVLDQVNAQDDAGVKLTGDGCVHTCIDRDGVAPSSIAQISRYPSYKKYRVDKKFSRTYAIKYPTGIWLDCQDPGSFSMRQELGLSGGITLYAEDILEDVGEVFNEPWAQVELRYNIVFQGKTSASLSGVFDASENLIGVTINKNDVTALKPQTPHRGVSGTLVNDTLVISDETDVVRNDQGVVVYPEGYVNADID